MSHYFYNLIEHGKGKHKNPNNNELHHTFVQNNKGRTVWMRPLFVIG